MKRGKPIRQLPETMHTFIRKDGTQDTGVLPRVGESNDFAVWNSDSRGSLGGWWKSRLFSQEARRKSDKEARKGKGRTGIFGRFCRIKAQSKYDCKNRGTGIGISNTVEEMLGIWNSQNGFCKCGSVLNILEAHADHNHETGKLRAFLHPTCNVIEGLLSNKTKTEIENLLAWFWGSR
jgi:hypothetical protein